MLETVGYCCEGCARFGRNQKVALHALARNENAKSSFAMADNAAKEFSSHQQNSSFHSSSVGQHVEGLDCS